MLLLGVSPPRDVGGLQVRRQLEGRRLQADQAGRLLQQDWLQVHPLQVERGLDQQVRDHRRGREELQEQLQQERLDLRLFQ